EKAIKHNIGDDNIISETDTGTQVTTVSGSEEEVHTDSVHTTVSAENAGTAISTSLKQKKTTVTTVKGTTKNKANVYTGKTVSAHNGGFTETTTTLGGTGISPTDEGSIDMKKITAFTTAFLAGFAALPITANANDNYRFYSFDTTDDKKIIAYMSDGQLDLDYDGNGKFDINDVYQFYLYADGYIVDDSVKQKAEANGDFDGSGMVDPYTDAIVLIKYYIISNPLDTSIFNVDNYEPASPTPEVQAELDMYYDENEPHYTSAKYFASNLEFQMRYLGTGYGFMKEKVDSGEISPDVNGDGVFDVADCVDYKIFVDNLLYYDQELFDRYNESLVEGVINWNQDGLFYTGITTQPYNNEYNPCPVDVIKLPEDTIVRCADVLSKIGNYGGKDSGRYMAYCYLLDNPLDEAYFSKDYYEKYYKGASGYEINSSFIFAARTTENIEYCSSFDKAKFQDEFKQYCKDIADGKKPAPDMNLDGKVDSVDYDDAIIYLNNTFFPLTGEAEKDLENDLPLPKKEWDNFANNCDLNGDGKSGGIYDIVMLQCYTLLNDDESFNKSASQEFRISREFHSNFALLDSIDIERNGDANLDGKTDISDAVLIMQTNSNPDKYEMKDKGKFNADVNETGDGITSKDAQHIQKTLLALG
ncbi:MAG: hypothetical protein J5864_00635, partial [Oscillospiraceae bacterium]|nr:hypothetical protein [Oscillospiraceae bacterium]